MELYAKKKCYYLFDEIGIFRRKKWEKKTKFSKTEACLFIFYSLLIKKRINKLLIEKILELDNRITIYNYIIQIQQFISNFENNLDYIIDIYYDYNSKDYVLELRKKK